MQIEKKMKYYLTKITFYVKIKNGIKSGGNFIGRE